MGMGGASAEAAAVAAGRVDATAGATPGAAGMGGATAGATHGAAGASAGAAPGAAAPLPGVRGRSRPRQPSGPSGSALPTPKKIRRMGSAQSTPSPR